MSRFRIIPAWLFTLILAVAGAGSLVFAANWIDDMTREQRWKKVDEAIGKGLPQTAIKELEPIIDSAMKDKAFAEAIKALTRKLVLEGTIQGNQPDEKVKRLKLEMAKTPAEIRPVLDAILGHWYWQYFQQSRWRFMQRTQTETTPGDDFTTWDLPRLFAEIDKQFTAALASEELLKKTKISDYDALIEKGDLPDSYRPTLWDFIVWDALSFYQSGEQAGSKMQDAFEFDASSPIFGSTAEFLKWKPETVDQSSLKLKAIQLYQKLLAFHGKKPDQSAFFDADLARLRFGFNFAFGEEKAARYKAALKKFIDENADSEMSAYARSMLAEAIYNEGDYVAAKAIAQQGVNTFPKSRGGLLCKNLILNIEAKSVQLNTERVWNAPWPVVRVSYRNIDTVYLRAYAVDWEKRLNGTPRRWRPEQYDQNDQAMLQGKPAATWTAELTPTADHKERHEDVAVPKDLKPGFYFIFASNDKNFKADQQSGPLGMCPVWVSDLALIFHSNTGNGNLEGFVLKNESGDPVNGAKLRTWKRDNRNNQLIVGPVGTTDANGRFSIPIEQNTSWLALAEFNGQSLASESDHYAYRNPGNGIQQYGQVAFFTDRAIYRPGQSVKFNGIAMRIDQEKDNYNTVANQDLTVIFSDVNGKEVAKLAVKSNDFGSFSGSFTAPRDRLTGVMTIRVQDGKFNGATQVRVEEYKRPQFEVTVDSPKEVVKLNGPVTLAGKAMAYTGASVNGAKVTYRVTREVRFPDWWYGFYYWRMPPNRGAAQEIAHGNTVTDADGSFKVTFTAKPDLSVAEKDEPKFTYRLVADVTDTTGETRSGEKSVTVGYTALEASVNVDEWLTSEKPITLKITTTTPNGDPASAKGTVKAYALKQPASVIRSSFFGGRPTPRPIRGRGAAVAPKPNPEGEMDPADPRSWALGEQLHKLDFATKDDGKQELTAKLEPGIYRAVLETQDAFGKPVGSIVQLLVIKPDDKKFPVKLANHVAAEKWQSEPGAEFRCVWGTGYDRSRAFVQVIHRGKVLQQFWTDPERTQIEIKQAVNEAMRGGFTIQINQVRENRAYLTTHKVDVPWSNKDLTVKWERFTSKLEPGQKETWTAVVTGPKAIKATAEFVACLYDASLDAFAKHNWILHFNVFRQDYVAGYYNFENHNINFNQYAGWWQVNYAIVPNTYRHYPADITNAYYGFMFPGDGGGFGGGGRFGRGAMGGARMAGGAPGMGGMPAPMSAAASDRPSNMALGLEKRAEALEKAKDGAALFAEAPGMPPDAPPINLAGISPRKNLSETAFFLPHLMTEENGTVRISFQMPEAVTKWRFMGFAHDKELRSGYLEGDAVTAKDLMVRPNPPRFLREGDQLEFTVKVNNQSPTTQKGQVKLLLKDARTDKPIDSAFGITGEQSFDLAAKGSKTFSWKLTVPDGQGPVIYTAVAGTDRTSDGEEGMLPVLSKRILVQESLPLPIRGMQTKTFDFKKLIESGKSDTIKSQSLTVQMVSQPAWYAVLALPYLMEYPYECSEQTFNRLYANMLARHIAQKDPKIRRVFNIWRDSQPNALKSPMEKNQDLKAVILEETPWVRDADKETQARKNVGILFDDNRLNDETARAMAKLADMQNADGLWPWFPGGRSNEFISMYIATGFGRMRHLGVKVDVAPAVKAWDGIDAMMDRIYHLIKPADRDKNHLSTTVAFYLYGRSFFMEDKPVNPQYTESFNYWKSQAQKYWLQLANRQSQGHIALALKRLADRETPTAIMNSIRERSVSNEEMGMFWRDTEQQWFWYRAPIETQAVMIEAFDEVANDAKAVEDCKVWLLKQKQTQNWKTTKATADAVYALLLRGDNLLSSDELVEVKLGNNPIKPENVEAGTGFYEEKFVKSEIKPDMGKITVKKTDAGVSWGSVHWSYLEDISKVTPHTDTPLKLEKKLFKKVNTNKGPTLVEVKGAIEVGDELVCRVVLRSDRDLEYVHMRDHRGSGTEPVNVLSRYKFQDGLAYYESTKDTATHFFIDYLPKGTYVFEYSVRVQLRGKYTTGLANIQCMYAPEFSSHSESIPLEVK